MGVILVMYLGGELVFGIIMLGGVLSVVILFLGDVVRISCIFLFSFFIRYIVLVYEVL